MTASLRPSVMDPIDRNQDVRWCQLCASRGISTKLKVFQLNLSEAVTLCPDNKCTYPIGVAGLLEIQERDAFTLPSSDLLKSRREPGQKRKRLSSTSYSAPTSRCTSPSPFSPKISRTTNHYQEKTTELHQEKNIGNNFTKLNPRQTEDIFTFSDTSSNISDDSNIFDLLDSNNTNALEIKSHRKGFLHWRNKDALCWLDVSMCMLVHSQAVRRLISNVTSKNSLTASIIREFNKAQEIFNNVSGKRVSLETSIGKVTVKTGGGEAPPRPSLLEDCYRQESVSCLDKALKTLNDIRELAWRRIQPKLRCQRGENDSPVFALPLILRESAPLMGSCMVHYRWSMTCTECGYQHTDSVTRCMPTFPNVTSDFNMTRPGFVRDCFVCPASNQKMKMEFEKLPPILFVHFVEGLNCGDYAGFDFTHQGSQYKVSAVIQYKTNPNHFVAWIRNTSDNTWMECDDLNDMALYSYPKPPSFPPSQVHIVMWEQEIRLTSSPKRASMSPAATNCNLSTPQQPMAKIQYSSHEIINMATSTIKPVTMTTWSSPIPHVKPANLATTPFPKVVIATSTARMPTILTSTQPSEPKPVTSLSSSTSLKPSLHRPLNVGATASSQRTVNMPASLSNIPVVSTNSYPNKPVTTPYCPSSIPQTKAISRQGKAVAPISSHKQATSVIKNPCNPVATSSTTTPVTSPKLLSNPIGLDHQSSSSNICPLPGQKFVKVKIKTAVQKNPAQGGYLPRPKPTPPSSQSTVVVEKSKSLAINPQKPILEPSTESSCTTARISHIASQIGVNTGPLQRRPQASGYPLPKQETRAYIGRVAGRPAPYTKPSNGACTIDLSAPALAAKGLDPSSDKSLTRMERLRRNVEQLKALKPMASKPNDLLLQQHKPVTTSHAKNNVSILLASGARPQPSPYLKAIQPYLQSTSVLTQRSSLKFEGFKFNNSRKPASTAVTGSSENPPMSVAPKAVAQKGKGKGIYGTKGKTSRVGKPPRKSSGKIVSVSGKKGKVSDTATKALIPTPAPAMAATVAELNMPDIDELLKNVHPVLPTCPDDIAEKGEKIASLDELDLDCLTNYNGLNTDLALADDLDSNLDLSNLDFNFDQLL